MKRAIPAAAALLAATAAAIALSLPPRRLALPVPAGAGPGGDGTVPGAFHVHTNRSDGRSSPDEVAAAAARAGLAFLIFTDHGDATAPPEPPVYRHGVLCLDAVEISTIGGHYAAIGLPAAPYPLGGEARTVIEDVRRLGGFGVVAHPDSPKEDLRWREWNEPFDAIELVNLDSGWRARVREPGWRRRIGIVPALVGYPFRPAETIAGLLGESNVALARWEAVARRRPVVALAGVDAHAKLALADVDPGDNRYSLPLPGYESSFRTLSLHVRPERPLSGDAAADAALLTAALRRGRVYTALAAIAAPPFFEFTAANDRGHAQQGDELQAGGPVTLRVRTNAPVSFTTTVWRGSEILSGDHHEPDVTVAAPADPAVYRVEIRATDRARAPLWLLSNPIYLRGPSPATRPAPRPEPTDEQPLFNGRDTAGWSVETDAVSVAALDLVQGLAGRELRLRFGLATGAPADQFAALTVAAEAGLGGRDRLTFTARADREMRVSVQLRVPVSPTEDERWQRSVYLDTTDREHTIYLDDVAPIGVTRTYRPPLAEVRSILLAIETTNTAPGTSGRVWVRDVRLQR